MLLPRGLKTKTLPVLSTAWYKKNNDATFSDIMAFVWRNIWSSQHLDDSTIQHDYHKIKTDHWEALLDHLSRAAVWPKSSCRHGTYHFCSGPGLTWHEFANELWHYIRAQRSVTTEIIEAINTAQLARSAARPAHAVFNCSKILTDFAITQ